MSSSLKRKTPTVKPPTVEPPTVEPPTVKPPTAKRETPSVDAPKSSVSARFILFAMVLGVVVGFAAISDDRISAGCVFLVLCATYLGYRNGALKISTGVIGMLIAIRYAAPLAEMMAPCSVWLVNLPAPLQPLVILSIAFCLIAILVYSALRIASRRVFSSKPHWKAVDRWLGAALGLVEGVVISLLLLFSLVILEPIAQMQLRRPQEANSAELMQLVSTNIVDWSAQLRQSSMGTLMEEMDPIRVHFANRVQDLSKAMKLGPSSQ